MSKDFKKRRRRFDVYSTSFSSQNEYRMRKRLFEYKYTKNKSLESKIKHY